MSAPLFFHQGRRKLHSFELIGSSLLSGPAGRASLYFEPHTHTHTLMISLISISLIVFPFALFTRSISVLTHYVIVLLELRLCRWLNFSTGSFAHLVRGGVDLRLDSLIFALIFTPQISNYDF